MTVRTSFAKASNNFIFIVGLSFLFIAYSCSDEKDSDPNIAKEQKRLSDSVLAFRADSTLRAEQTAKYDVFPKIKYQTLKIENSDMLYRIRRDYGANNWKEHRVIKTLNRKEIRYFRVGQKIVVPDTFMGDLKAYSLFPQYYHEARNIDKLIMVSNKWQCYASYENGVQVYFAAVNSGKERTPTFPGKYSLVWKEEVRRSSLDSNWVMPYTWNFHAMAGSAFHKFDMPGYPASHSCVRQFMEDAKWLFYWGKGAKRDSNKKLIPHSGTVVIILDIYDFSRGKDGLWYYLTSNKDSIIDLPIEPLAVEDALIPWCQIPESSRWFYTGKLKNKFFYAEDTLRARGVIRPNVNLIPTRNFNKERREKEALEAKKRLDSLKKIQPNIDSNSLQKIKEQTFMPDDSSRPVKKKAPADTNGIKEEIQE